MIRFLALDIDGTLLNSRWELPPDNIAAVAECVAAGVEVALVTGRRFDFARPVMDELSVPLTMIVSNGAVVKDGSGATLARRILARDVAARILAMAGDWRDCAGLLFDRTHDAQIVFERIDPEDEKRHRFYEINRHAIAQRPLDSCLDEDPVQIMFSGALGRMRALYRFLRGGQSHFPENSEGKCDCPLYSVSITEYEHRDFALLDVMASGCSKGAAVADWAARRGYTRDEVMAIGDNLNDFEMLEFAGLPVVMGNAAAGLFARANGWRVTATNDEGGVALAIREHILRR
ncbi:MAG TPA: Cof-type HAD-IIB family hydrolase [Vicinamibacterales bacterium]|nr:Cof-type HAD-IIB family hydrolase [Vicinamibacterales bacterium]